MSNNFYDSNSSYNLYNGILIWDAYEIIMKKCVIVPIKYMIHRLYSRMREIL